MRILLAVEAVDFRKGIDGLARLCRVQLKADPFSGALFVFRNRRGTAIKILVYDGQGYWLCHKRLSCNRFHSWPKVQNGVSKMLRSHELHVLICGGNPDNVKAPLPWRRIIPQE